MIDVGYKDCAVKQYSQKGSNDPEEVRKRAMNDPEVQQIMGDPAMRMILEQMQSDPQAGLGISTKPCDHAENYEAQGCWTDLH